MRVLLVNVPWASTDVPSLALGILRRSVTERVSHAQIDVLHANIDYADWIARHMEFSYQDYRYFSLNSYFDGCGDWVFSAALYDDPHWREDEFIEHMTGRASGQQLALCRRLHELAPLFVRELAERIVELAPQVVGFTSTFQQNAAALAVAQQVKRLLPDVVTVLGGANCDGPQGAAMHRNFPFLDFVVRGEGEVAFPGLLSALESKTNSLDIPGLCWRDDSGHSVANPISTRPLPPGEIVAPDYNGYFQRVAASRIRSWSEPKLVVEGSRGCWWGEKHHCTFCGLNGSFMEFRSKSPQKFFNEIVELSQRHQVLDMYLVDNILDMAYITSLLPALIDAGHDFRLHCEIKSNLRRDQLQTLADAGLVHVQPGIESLSSRVLKIMDKGVTGCQNVRMLRDAESIGMSVEWNYLYGFPGEEAEEYTSILEQLKSLHHLPPPGSSGRIAIERFSPYFDRPELGFSDLRPDPQYAVTYDLPEAELHDLAYLFQAPPRGIDEDTAGRLSDAVTDWQVAYPHSRLTRCDLGDHFVMANRRLGFKWTKLRIEDPLEVAALRLLDQPHSRSALIRKLARQFPTVGDASVTALLRHLDEFGLIFTEGDHYVQVAADMGNQELLRSNANLSTLLAPSPVPALATSEER